MPVRAPTDPDVLALEHPGPRPTGWPSEMVPEAIRSSSGDMLWNLDVLRMFPSIAGRTAGIRPLRCRSVAPGIRKAKAPTKGLSTLNSMAFGLAVYASPHGLPRLDARLASSRWSDATGRASHPQGSYERFPRCFLHRFPLSQASWRRQCPPFFCLLTDLPERLYNNQSRKARPC